MPHLLLGGVLIVLAATHLSRPQTRAVRIAKDTMTIGSALVVLIIWSQL
ncbi:hypothetical protein ACQEU8_36125 [Streptomyces sp. CA-250714]